VLINSSVFCARNIQPDEKSIFLDFKLSPYSECCILSFGWYPGVWIVCADVSEHSGNAIFIGGVSRKNNWEEILHSLHNYSSCLHHLWRWNWQSVPKHRHIKFRRRGITQKKEYKNLFLLTNIFLISICFFLFWKKIITFKNHNTARLEVLRAVLMKKHFRDVMLCRLVKV
jgi:hypothetical protein